MSIKIENKQSSVLEPTMNLRFRDVRTQIGWDNYKYIRTLQQMWIDKSTGKTEWKSIPLDNASSSD